MKQNQIDYWKRLTVTEQNWLRAFEQQYDGQGKSDGSAACLEGYGRNNRRQRDALIRSVSIENLPILSNQPSPELQCMWVEKKFGPLKQKSA